MIAVIDYGLGNLRSVQKAFERIGQQVVISDNLKQLSSADKLILPGVGHFSIGMKNILNGGFKQVLEEQIIVKKKPILGICLGMQLMTSFSEEGNCDGLNWINARTLKFDFAQSSEKATFKIPHMGWNTTKIKKKSPILQGVTNGDFFYFVHSYYVKCNNEEDVLQTTDYGIQFHSGFCKDNIFGVQFHPEKSHTAGLNIIKNFVKI